MRKKSASSKKRSNRRAKTAKRRLAAVLVVLAVVAVIVVFAVFMAKRGEPKKLKLTELPFAAGSESAYTGRGFYYLSDSTLIYDDLKDSAKDETRKISVADVGVVASERTAVLYTLNAIHFVNASKPVEFSDRIIAVKAGKEHFGVLYGDARDKSTLAIFDDKAVQIDSVEFSGGVMTDYSFDMSGGEVLWTLETNVNASDPICMIKTYDMQRHSVSSITTVHDQLVENVFFTDNSMFIVGTDSIIRYNVAKHHESYRALVYGRKLMDFSAGGERPLFAFSLRSEEKLSTVVLYSLSDDDVSNVKMTTVQLPGNALGAYTMCGSFVVIMPDGIKCYTGQGSLSREYRFDMPITAAEKLTDSELLLVRDGKAFIAKIG